MNYNDFTVSAIHILPECEETLLNSLKDEWYFFNNRLKIGTNGRMIVVPEDRSFKDFYGQNVNISAIVGMNGSGKSSLLEIEYRIINNLSCILNKGKRRRASETLYYIDGLYAELHFVVDNQWGCISCQGQKIILTLPGQKEAIHLDAFPTRSLPNGTEVLMKDFIQWARQGLFYTIVTNYSIQSFIARDFIEEPVFLLDNKHGKFHKEEASWINGLFHKNDGYMTPLVLNPYRDDGVINMLTEHRLTLYRLSSCFIHARNNKRQFIRNYELHSLSYEYNPTFVQDKLVKNWDASENAIWNYRPNTSIPSYADVILNSFGFTGQNLDWGNDIIRNAALYLADKTLSVARHYPGYEEFKSLDNSMNIFNGTTSETSYFLEKLVKTVLSHKSHETIKIHQVVHFLNACKNTNIDKNGDFDLRRPFSYDDYVRRVGGNPASRKMYEILEFLPPSLFSIKITLDSFDQSTKTNVLPISVERLSSGERQYLYTFSTYIYHILNILSIQQSSRVRYRNINLVLDEVEICFHPEYQRRFIYELVNYIERMQLNTNAAINIQIATHSPFILSDVMESNVLYLHGGKTADKSTGFKNPFCANICDLLYQSFFLDNGFYGEYSRLKLNEVLHLLKIEDPISEDRIEYIKALERVIGDDFLKMHIHQLMDKRGITYEKVAD